MKTISIPGLEKTSHIHVGASLKDLPAYLPAARTIVISDENVVNRHGDRFPSREIIVIGQGEGVKTLDTVSMIYDRLIARQADRSVYLLGIGGGIVCDITGFVASTYLRGVGFAYCPTTLLAQVDASVGGKTGVNFHGYKNMVGVFNQPDFVLCDPAVLQTLPRREVACGFAEVVKHAAIADIRYFEFLEHECRRAFALEPEVMERVVHDSVAIKAGVVSRDEREKGERRKLNFGHTFGHAVEKTQGLSHGEAVSIGMMLAANFSEKRRLLDNRSVERLSGLLSAFDLPVSFSGDKQAIMDAVCRDKKREGDFFHFILLEAIGRAVVASVSLPELAAVLPEG